MKHFINISIKRGLRAILFLIVLIPILILSSCELNEPVYTFRTDETLLESEGSTNAFLNLSIGYKEFFYYWAEFPSNPILNSISYVPASNHVKNILGDNNQTPSNTRTSNLWSHTYRAIASTNIQLSLLPKAPQTATEKNAVGMTRLYRAAHYLILVRMYGGLPLVKSPDDENVPRSSLDQTFQFIVDELEVAYDFMSPEQNPLKQESPKKMAAAAYLSVAYHHWASVTGNMGYWASARDWAKIVIDAEGSTEGYSLLADYAHLWDLQHEFSNESIHELPWTRNGQGNGTGNNMFFAPAGSNYASRPQNRAYMGGQVVDSLMNIYGNEPDYRMLTQTNIKQTYSWNGGTQTKVSYPYTKDEFFAIKNGDPSVGYEKNIHVKKYSDPNTSGNTGHENNSILLRYSEILLIAAEAENEINGGPTANAIEYLNRVLTRARNGEKYPEPVNVNVSDFTGMENFRNRILMERINEFTGEHHIWMDERRFGADYLKSVIEWQNNRFDYENTSEYNDNYIGGHPGVSFKYPTDDSFIQRNLLWPIPDSEIINNDGMTQADQNPGY